MLAVLVMSALLSKSWYHMCNFPLTREDKREEYVIRNVAVQQLLACLSKALCFRVDEM